jgi:MFS family permease
MTPVRTLLRTPGVRAILATSLVARLPMGALGLLLLLRARELGHSYAVGGLAAGALSLGFAAAPPVLGRLIDARGARAVLLPTAVAGSGVLLLLASPLASAPAALVALGALAGLVHPPVSASVRVLWRRLLDDADARHSAMSLESALVEISYLLGPLVLVGVFAAWSPSAGLAASGAALFAGTLAFALQPVLTPDGGARGTWRGGADGADRALRSPLVRTLLAAQIGLGLSFGGLEVAVTAFAADHATAAATGPLLAIWGLGSLFGGLAAAHRPPPPDPAARLVRLLSAMAVTNVLLLVAPSIAVLAAGLLLAGAAIAPALALLYGTAAEGGPDGAATEAQAWLSTGIGVGIAGGSALAGGLVDLAGDAGAFLLGAGGAAVALAIIAARAATLRPRAAALPATAPAPATAP